MRRDLYGELSQQKNGAKIKGTSKADQIHNNGGNNVSINAGAGNDHIQNSGSNVKIFGGKGADTIRNWKEGNKVTISDGSGNDYITNNGGSKVSISGGAGNDYIYNAGSNVTLDGGAGNDSIDNGGSKVLFVYSGGNDYISGFNATSTLKISSDTVSSVKTNGYDYFVSVGKSIVTLQGAAQFGKANIVNSKGKAVKYSVNKNFSGTAKNDNFTNFLDSAKITAGKGDDYIYNYGAKVSINAGDGSDRIYNQLNINWNDETNTYETLSSPDNATIIAGKGNDLIYNDGANVKFVYSGGDDTISGFNATSTLQISSGTISSVMSNGEDYLIKIGKNILRVNGAAKLSKVNIVNSKGNAINFTVKNVNTITNKKNTRTLTGTADRDKITNSGKKVLINGAGGDGNDSINNTGSQVTINGGAGNDEIINNGEKVSINAGAGNDSIRNWGANTTIRGGKGNDSLWGSDGADKFIYSAGDDKDFIYGFDDNDTLTLNNLNFKASYKNDAVTLNFNSGSVTLKDFTATTFHIDKDTYKISGSKFVKK